MTNLVNLNKNNSTVVSVTKQSNLVLEVNTDSFRGTVIMNPKHFNKIRNHGSVEGVLVEPINYSAVDKVFLGFSFN